VRPATSFTGADDGSPGGLWTTTPAYKWRRIPRSAASYVSAPLGSNTVVIGGGALQLWLKVDAERGPAATISEVRPDGKETFVQDGWLRADERKLDAAKSTLLERCSAFAAPTWRRCPPAATPR